MLTWSPRCWIASIILFGMSALAPPARGNEPWFPLFNGTTLDGWKVSESVGAFQVVDGVISFNGPRAHAFYTGPFQSANFRNFEFKVDINAAPGANSGVYFHTKYQDTN